jgi:hypothetical protein
MQVFDSTVKDILNEKLVELEQHFQADVVFYYGEIFDGLVKPFRDCIEQLQKDIPPSKRLVFVLNTPGGSAETVEKMVEIVRYHYDEVFFIVPDYAMSAGTIFCMSGNKIFMDYTSSLGPIDPQVYNGETFVPALGYLDQVEKMLAKAANNTLTQAEFLILQKQDLAMLNQYEQQRNLTITLLKKWLVEYKFATWTVHRTDPNKKNQAVTPDEKETRAEEIARLLGDNKTWHSHGRFIGARTLQDFVRLEVEDYSGDLPLRSLIRSYNDLLTEYISRNNFRAFMHSRHIF